ncbi:hypothetical protein GA0070606_6414 [Micromonospora citrea]|uniref:Uncharacterized protein n=1 Tax=Micromonospora citrea TaxID=47855 RepID=A0A1C6W3N9_9ACTN|nr:hypothetical protein [Micromonospora citrea]SCL73024.1 hypothetical protein GA0070606_6414 [Micromonospora citrea]
MGLIQIEGTAEVLRGLRGVAGLDLIDPSAAALGGDRYRISAYAPEELIPELQARGAQVRVMMSTGQFDAFHAEVARHLAPPPESSAPPESAGER